jgi:hypothetical protein
MKLLRWLRSWWTAPRSDLEHLARMDRWAGRPDKGPARLAGPRTSCGCCEQGDTTWVCKACLDAGCKQGAPCLR